MELRMMFSVLILPFVISCDKAPHSIEINLTNLVKEGEISYLEDSYDAPALNVICGPHGLDDEKLIYIAISKGANVNDQRAGDTPLMTASMWLNVACVRVLLENGADRDLRSPDGKRAIDLVGHSNNSIEETEIYRLLSSDR